MRSSARFPVMAVGALSLLTILTGCQRLQARDQLNKGVASYKNQKYEEAIDHFQEAVQLDPKLPMARLYLATAYAQGVVADTQTPENLKLAQQAIDTYKQVLEEDPKDVGSLKGIAALYLNIEKFDDAKEWQRKVLAVDPNDAEAAYTIGVIDFGQARKNLLKEIAPATDDGKGNAKMDKKTCLTLQQENTPLIDEGFQYLNRSVEIRPAYDDAMAYLNLLYRRKADIECGNDAARKDDLAKADAMLAKAIGTRKANEDKKNAGPGGIVMDSSGNMK